MFKATVIFLGFIFGMTIFAMPYIDRITDIENKREVKINEQLIIAENAATPLAREKGLSGRNRIGFNEGMFFVFDKADKYGFWMKGMKFPIDIVWIRENRVVGTEENIAPPQTTDLSELTIYHPPLPVDRVLEVSAGRVRLMRVKIGDKVYVRPLLAPQRLNGRNE